MTPTETRVARFKKQREKQARRLAADIVRSCEPETAIMADKRIREHTKEIGRIMGETR